LGESDLHSGPGFGRLGLTLAEVASAMGAAPAPGAAAPEGLLAARVLGVTTDSRSAGPGTLFVGLKGERLDGRDFAAKALEAGALAAVVGPGPPVAPGRPSGAVLEAPDPLAALRALAGFVRRRVDPAVAAVTGSVGKTTVKDIVRSIFEAAAGAERVLATRGNLNNHVGVPLTLLSMGPETAWAVIEMGASDAGEIAPLAAMARPDAGLVTAVAPAHLAGFQSLERTARAKGELYQGLAEGAVAVVNAGDPLVVREAERFGGSKLYFGILPPAGSGAAGTGRPDPAAMVTARLVEDLGLAGQRIRLDGPGLGSGGLETPLALMGPHNVLNAAAAAALALAVGIGWDGIAAGLGAARAPEGRLKAAAGRGGLMIIDDSYNANPASMEAALRFAGSLSVARSAVLGDMLELGAGAEAAHRRAGALAAEAGLSRLAVVGDLAGILGEAAVEAGLGPEAVARFDDPAEAARWAASGLAPGAAVLVKGSRGMAMERAARFLMD
jgi:UDP-N-acetylmuramoyl-tripeptide--D-alanyl-D-alanine ligase